MTFKSQKLIGKLKQIKKKKGGGGYKYINHVIKKLLTD